MVRGISVIRMTRISMIVAVYVALSMALAPVSYGVVQFRIAEALVMFCIFVPDMIIAVTLGCGMANFVGFMMGVNPIPMDILFGTLATLLAGILTYTFRNIRFKGLPILSMIPPIIINGLIIGAELTWLETGRVFARPVFLINAGSVAISEVVPCIIGLVLVVTLERTKIINKYL